MKTARIVPALRFSAYFALFCLAAPLSAQPAAAVSWGGQYVDADLSFADDTPANRTGSDAYGDPDGPFPVGGTDSIAGRALSLDNPFSPAAGYSGVSGTFYGGGSVTRTNSLTNDGFSELTVLNQGPNDSLHWHIDTGGDDHTFHLLLYWDKVDFLGGLDQVNGLDLSEGAFTLSTAQSSGHHTDEVLHWVVRDGTQFYVSQDTIVISNNSDYVVPYSSLTNWAVYTPLDPSGTPTDADLWSLDFNETGPFAPHTFTDVTALGFYVEHEAATGPIHVHIEGFQADLVPEPSGMALLLAIFAVPFLPRRRADLQSAEGG